MATYYKTTEVAKKYKIPVNQIHNWFRDGSLLRVTHGNKIMISSASLERVKRLSVIYHIRKVLEEHQGRRIRTDITKRTLREMAGGGDKNLVRFAIEEIFGIAFQLSKWDNFSYFIDYVTKNWNPDEPIGKKVYYGESDHNYLTSCPRKMVYREASGSLIDIKVGDEHCRKCAYFDSINTKDQYVICTKDYGDKAQKPEQPQKPKQEEKGLKEKFYEKIGQLWGAHKVIEKAVEQNTIDVGVVKKGYQKVESQIEHFRNQLRDLGGSADELRATADRRIDLLLLRLEKLKAMIDKTDSPKPTEPGLNESIRMYKYTTDANDLVLNTPCPFDKSGQVHIGSGRCSNCIRFKGIDKSQHIVFCDFPTLKVK